MNANALSHESRAHIYTDEFTCTSIPGAEIVIPAHDASLAVKMSHVTSYTAAELTAIYKDMEYSRLNC